LSCEEKNIGDATGISKIDSVTAIADKYADAGHAKEAFSMVQYAHATMKGLTLQDHIDYYSYCNIIYNHAGQHDKSIEIADSMLRLLNNYAEDKVVATARVVAYNIKADALFAKGMYNDAYNYYFIAQKLAVESRDSCSLRTYTYSLAMTLFRQQRYQQSAMRFIDAYNQSAPCPEDFNLFYFKQEILDNIGLCYNALGKYDSAMLFYEKALNYINTRKDNYKHKLPMVFEAAKAVVYGNMAEVYMHQAKYDSAKLLYEYSININLRKGYTNSDAIINQVKLADLYFNTGDVAKSKQTLDAIKAELDTIADKRVEMLWHKQMWRYSEHVHDSVQGFRHLRMYTLMNEDYVNGRKDLMETDLDMRVKDLEKQYKINLLIKDKKQQRIFLIVAIVAALMAVAIILLVWRNARRSRRNFREISAANNTINEQKVQLQGALEELQNKEKDKTRILRSVAHDVMNPIAAIVSLTDILFYEKESLNEEQVHVINLIREASANSLNLSKDIIEAAEQHDDKSAEKEDTDINLLVARAVELLNFRALSKRQQIFTKYPPQHIMAKVYKDKIRRVINNLVANAIKFSYEGTVINVVLEQKGDMVHISVQDSGIGIPAKNLPHIFDVFTDARQAGTHGEMTHGLGLSISMQIAKAHNGDIWVESEEGKGATFHFEFPVKGE
jgi:signal transduction histidine kinase